MAGTATASTSGTSVGTSPLPPLMPPPQAQLNTGGDPLGGGYGGTGSSGEPSPLMSGLRVVPPGAGGGVGVGGGGAGGGGERGRRQKQDTSSTGGASKSTDSGIRSDDDIDGPAASCGPLPPGYTGTGTGTAGESEFQQQRKSRTSQTSFGLGLGDMSSDFLSAFDKVLGSN